MNILILHSSSGLYGSSKVLLCFSSAFRKKGHVLTVVLSEKGPLSDELQAMGIRVKIIRLGIIRKKYYSFTGLLDRCYTLCKAFLSLRKLIREEKIDLIYSNTIAVLIGAFTAKITRKKHIWHIHETIERPAFLFSFLGWMVSHFSDKAVVVSESVYDHWKKKIPADKLITIHNGFDYSAFDAAQPGLRNELDIDSDSLVIGTVGRIHYLKGQEYFLRIAGFLHTRFPGLKFLIVGDAFEGYEYLYDKLAAITRELNLEKSVYTLGFRSDIANIYKAIDIFVLPSTLADSFPTVILEAMASGVPVVATRQGGAVEMIEDGKSGILIPINEPEKAADIIGDLIKNKDMRIQMGKEAKLRVTKEFSLDAFNNAITDIIK